jgi:hypothetical protein
MVEAYTVKNGHGRILNIQDHAFVTKKMGAAFPNSLVENEKRNGNIYDEYWIGDENAISMYLIYDKKDIVLVLDDGLNGKDIVSKTKLKLEKIN